MTASTRHQTRPTRGGWMVIDTATGAVWTGLTRLGAQQLADHLNQRS